MPIETSICYTKEVLLQFNDDVVKSKKFLWWFFGICDIIILGCVFFCAALEALDFTLVMYVIVVFAVEALYVILYFVVPRFMVPKSKNLNIVLHFSFEENCFHLEGKNEYVEEHATAQYTMLTKVQKVGTMLYLFLNSRSAYLVDLKTLSTEQICQLKTTISAHLPPKSIKWADANQ